MGRPAVLNAISTYIKPPMEDAQNRNNQIPQPATKTTQSTPRIVLVDDEEVILELVEVLVRGWRKDFLLLKYQNRDEAWQELLRQDPDLLITDMRNDNVPGRTEDFGISGFELLTRLAKKQVKYPILAASGSFSISGCEALAKKSAGPDLNVAYLTKPYTLVLFYRALNKLIGPGDNSGFE